MFERQHNPDAASALLRELDDLQPQLRAETSLRSAPPAEDSIRWTQRPGGQSAAASGAWDRAAQWLLAGSLAFAPLAFGTVEAWSELVVVALAAAASGCV